MMKRSGALVLAVLYTVTALGFALNFHYCFNQLSSVGIDTPAKCVTGLPVAKMKCCKDKQVQVKVKDVHQGEAPSFLSKIFVIHLPKLPFEDFFFSARQSLLEKDSNRGPPEKSGSGISLFLKNCIFRI